MANRKEIKKLLIDRDLTQQAIANRLGVSLQYINMVIAGRKENREIQAKIAKELRVRVETIFGEKGEEH